MRYNQLLIESVFKDLEQEWESNHEAVWEQIEKDCSQILSLYRKHKRVLFRGVDNDSSIFFSESPESRKPINMPILIQEAIDEWLRENGFKALRKNSIFAVQSSNRAYVYGPPYVIFPVNGFNYTWFEKSFDLYYTFRRKHNFPDKAFGAKKPENIQEVMNAAMPQNNTGLDKLLAKKTKLAHEVMINGAYYSIGFKFSFDKVKDFIGFAFTTV